MATYSLYKTSISSQNDISSLVYAVSPISYRINEDFTFELPELRFESTQQLAVNTAIYVAETGNALTKHCRFYVKKAVYNAQKRLYEYICPHILDKLADVKIRSFADTWEDWSDNSSPGYAKFNNQLSDWYNQGQITVWSRCLVQCLFAMKMMIYKVSGVSVDTVDSSDIDEANSLYSYRSDWGGGNWQTTVLKYKELGLNLNSVFRYGFTTHTQFSESEFIKVYQLTNCLEVLRHICSALMITIDIFRADYKIQAFSNPDAPSVVSVAFQEKAFEPYRLFEVNIKRLTGGSFDWVYGYWDDEPVVPVYVPYTYGVNNADREITERQAAAENTSVGNIRCLGLRYPNFFRIYGITGTDYQAHTYYIYNGQAETYEDVQLLAAIQAFWEAVSAREIYEIETPGLELRVPYVEHNLAGRKMTYERLV